MFKFDFAWPIIFLVILYTEKHTCTHTQTGTWTDGHEYSIVVVYKPQLLIHSCPHVKEN